MHIYTTGLTATKIYPLASSLFFDFRAHSNGVVRGMSLESTPTFPVQVDIDFATPYDIYEHVPRLPKRMLIAISTNEAVAEQLQAETGQCGAASSCKGSTSHTRLSRNSTAEHST
jgi:hypothetical protein